MPGFYPIDEYDLAGFSVGIVDRDKVIDKNSMEEGDVMIALPSSGVHSNGFSLVRKVLDVENVDLKEIVGEEGIHISLSITLETKQVFLNLYVRTSYPPRSFLFAHPMLYARRSARCDPWRSHGPRDSCRAESRFCQSDGEFPARLSGSSVRGQAGLPRLAGAVALLRNR